MMLSDLSSDHEATGSNSHGGGDMASYAGALSPSLLLAPAASSTAPPQPEEPSRAPGAKRKRSQPGNPDPFAEVIALSPRTLVATNRFVCEICNKGFQRDQNLQLHRRGHNLPWKLRQRSSLPSSGGRHGGGAVAAPPPPRKRVYVCPEPTCVHHDPARALGDLTGIKKHFSRKHGEKRWRCERCGKRYAVQSDWKAHVKGCGTREYRCDCGKLFSRKDSLLTHRAFCDALAEESARLLAAVNNGSTITNSSSSDLLMITNSITTPLSFLPFSNAPPAAAAAGQNPNTLFFLPQEQSPFLQPRMVQVQHSPYLDLHVVDAAATGGGGIVTDAAVNYGGAGRLTHQDGSSAAALMSVADHRRLTRDFLGVVDGVGQVEELQLPTMCTTTAAAAAANRTASCATDLTRQYHVERLPPVNETWSHNYF